jgi:type I restriction enzyme S subunit
VSDWPTRHLEELCVRVTVGHVGSMAHEYVATGIPFLRSQNIKRGHLDLSEVKFISEDFHQRLVKSQILPGDLVIVRTGEPGATAMIPGDLGTANCSDVIIARPKPGVVGRYLCYAINATAQRFVDAHTVGAVQQHFNVASAKRLTLAVPPTATQKAIVAILGALDDKIAVNDRIACTARELGMAMYHSTTAESSKDTSIDEITDLMTRGQAPKYTDEPAGVTVVNQKCVRNGRIDLRPARRTEGARVKPDRVLQKYDVLVNSTGVGTLGRVGVWSHQVTATVDSHVTIVRIGSSVPAIVGGFAVLAVEPEIEALGEGSTGQTELSRSKLASLKVRIPERNVDNLANQLSALEERADAALSESAALAELRDTLLPELMSGRLRVRDAEKVVEEAAV